MSTPQFRPGSVDPSAFMGCPVNSFHAVRRRSLTVHLTDPDWWDVVAWAGANDDNDRLTYAGRYEQFLPAAVVAQKLNEIWKLVPGATAAEVVAFVRRDATAAPELLAMLEKIVAKDRAGIAELSAAFGEPPPAEVTELTREAEALIAKVKEGA